MAVPEDTRIRSVQIQWSSLSAARCQKMSIVVSLGALSIPFDETDSFVDPVLGLSGPATLAPLVSYLGWNCLFIRVKTLSALRYSVIDPAN